MSNRRYLWVDGELLPDTEKVRPAESKGEMYGAGCFETLRTTEGRFLHLERHLGRLTRGIGYLHGKLPSLLKPERMKKEIRRLLNVNGLSDRDACVRIQASLRGGRGFPNPVPLPIDLTISADPLPAGERGYSLKTAEVRVAPSSVRPSDLKLSNTLHYMKAWQQARKSGAHDALMCTIEGDLAETAVANLFWKKGDTIYSPSRECDILPGQMRRILLEILNDEDHIKVEEGRYRPAELNEADLVWISNSLKEFEPVSSVDGLGYPVRDSFYERLNYLLQQYKKTHLE